MQQVRVSRWITFPLVFAVLMTIPVVLLLEDLTFTEIVSRFTLGALSGFAVQAWSDLRARQRTGRNDDEIYKVRQERILTIFREPKDAVALCIEAMQSSDLMKLNSIKVEDHSVIGCTRWTWESFGNVVKIQVVELGDKLSEVRINTRPLLQTTAVDYGNGSEIADKLISYLRQNDVSIPTKVLSEGAEVISNAPRRPLDGIFVSADGRIKKAPRVRS